MFTLQIPMTVINGLVPTGTLLYSNALQMVAHLMKIDTSQMCDGTILRYWPRPLLPVQPSVAGPWSGIRFWRCPSSRLALKAGTWEVEGGLILPNKVSLADSER